MFGNNKIVQKYGICEINDAKFENMFLFMVILNCCLAKFLYNIKFIQLQISLVMLEFDKECSVLISCIKTDLFSMTAIHI